MKFTIIIKHSHLQNCYSALKFTSAIIQQNHQINFIYFINDSAYIANRNIDMPSDEYNLSHQWSEFADKHQLQLIVCTASALRRGISEDCLATGFAMGSIGQLVENCDLADRVISL